MNIQDPNHGTAIAFGNQDVAIASPTNVWNRYCTAYWDRVDSFSPLTYRAKPPSLAPFVCARFGWRNTINDRLVCDACQACWDVFLPERIGVNPPHLSALTTAVSHLHGLAFTNPQARVVLNGIPVSARARQQIVVHYQALLATQHKDTCPFRDQALAYWKGRQSSKHSSSDCTSASVEKGPIPLLLIKASSPIIPALLATFLPSFVTHLLEHEHPIEHVYRLWKQHVVNAMPVEHAMDPPMSRLILSADLIQYDPHNSGSILSTTTCPDANKDSTRTLLSRLVTLMRDVEVDLTTATTWRHDHKRSDRTDSVISSVEEDAMALILLGWYPNQEHESEVGNNNESNQSVKRSKNRFRCVFCRSTFVWGKEHDHSKRMDRNADQDADDDDDETVSNTRLPSLKRRRLQLQLSQSSSSCRRNPRDPITAHRFYCPYICGFPVIHSPPDRREQALSSESSRLGGNQQLKGNKVDDETDVARAIAVAEPLPPLWQSLASRLVLGSTMVHSMSTSTSPEKDIVWTDLHRCIELW